MKVRTDYVTNSSSSSFICVAKINDCNELRDYMKEEFGRFGERLLKNYLVTGKEIKEDKYDFDIFKEYCEENDVVIEDDSTYLQATFISWSTEGDSNGNDAFLYDNIPCKYKETIYEEDGE